MENIIKNIPKEKQEKIQFKQSANSLFRFVQRVEYLESILENKAFIPRFVEEDIRYLNFDNDIKYSALPMVCFCDINVNKLSLHSKIYGDYGIGIEKTNWGVTNNIQPIMYLNKNAKYIVFLKRAFKKTLKDEYIAETEEISDFLLEHISYIKPINRRSQIFHDEREWRYIPDVSELINQEGKLKYKEIIPQNVEFDKNALNIASEYFIEMKKSWLKFEYNDIKYIILAKKHQRHELIEFILKTKSIKEDEKYMLISKIVVLEEVEEDFV